MDPLSLLFWYCDDGSKRTNSEAMRLATQCWDYNELSVLQKCLSTHFGIETTLPKSGKSKDKTKQRYSISVNVDGYSKFFQLIQEPLKILVPEMEYKINPVTTEEKRLENLKRSARRRKQKERESLQKPGDGS